jgi:hypothetical protein
MISLKITKENLDETFQKIMEHMISRSLPYFNIVYADYDNSFTNCYFSPATQGNIFVDDYKRILTILMTHPKIKDLELVSVENDLYVSAIFEEERNDLGDLGDLGDLE